MRYLYNARLFWGLLLVIGGAILLLNQAGVTAIDLGDTIQTFWPVILIYFGAVGLIDTLIRAGRSDRGEVRGLLWGTALVNGVITIAGALQLGFLLGLWVTDAGWLWSLVVPAILIIGGLRLLQSGTGRPGARTHWAVMGGGKIGRGEWQLSDLAVVAFMGGSDIDLSQATVPETGDVQIDLWSVMGGSTLRIPPHLSYTLEEVAIMGGTGTEHEGGGGLIDYRVTGDGSRPVLRIRSFSLMGGSKIKRV